VQTAKHKIIYKPTVTVRVHTIVTKLKIKVIIAIAIVIATVWFVSAHVGNKFKLGKI
jgi:hypothetical protein